MRDFTNATMHVDIHTGKQYLVQNGNSGKVCQYAAGVHVWFDGSCKAGGKTGVEIFKSRKDLNSWLKMMGFKK